MVENGSESGKRQRAMTAPSADSSSGKLSERRGSETEEILEGWFVAFSADAGSAYEFGLQVRRQLSPPSDEINDTVHARGVGLSVTDINNFNNMIKTPFNIKVRRAQRHGFKYDS